MAAAGLPLLAVDAGLRASWQRLQEKLAPTTPRFRFAGYRDIPETLRQAAHTGTLYLHESPAALLRIGAGRPVATELGDWQRLIEARIASNRRNRPGCSLITVESG